MTLKLTQNVLNTYVGWKAQVLHDLHESEAFLYDNTIGDGPYNAWLDPMLTNEWQMIGWNNVQEMTRYGMPGVYAHRRLRHVVARLPDVHRRDAQRHQPPLRNVRQRRHGRDAKIARCRRRNGRAHVVQAEPAAAAREVVAAQQQQLRRDRDARLARTTSRTTGICSSENFYEKSKRSIEKAKVEGPAAYVFRRTTRASARRRSCCASCRSRRVEISRATAPFTVNVPTRAGRQRGGGAVARRAPAAVRRWPRRTRRRCGGAQRPSATPRLQREFPAGSYIMRMDQPYSRIADALLDYQYLGAERSAEDAVRRHRLDLPRGLRRAGRARDRREGARRADASASRATIHAPWRRRPAPARSSRSTQRRQRAGHAALQAEGRRHPDGGRAVRRGRRRSSIAGRSSFATCAVRPISTKLTNDTRPQGHRARRGAVGEDASRCARRASRSCTPGRARRPKAGGVRRSTVSGCRSLHRARGRRTRTPDLQREVRRHRLSAGRRHRPERSSTGCRCGATRCRGRTPPETPNIGTWAQTDDMRPGLGYGGLENLLDFVKRGGVMVGATNTAEFAIQFGADERRQQQLAPARRSGRQLAAYAARGRHEPDRVRRERQPRRVQQQR